MYAQSSSLSLLLWRAAADTATATGMTIHRMVTSMPATFKPTAIFPYVPAFCVSPESAAELDKPENAADTTVVSFYINYDRCTQHLPPPRVIIHVTYDCIDCWKRNKLRLVCKYFNHGRASRGEVGWFNNPSLTYWIKWCRVRGGGGVAKIVFCIYSHEKIMATMPNGQLQQIQTKIENAK